ncbi:hypothetical protein C0995_015108 [Termitomyces sp. Mi166|nr:hypothetical protein C0995_015108 [Termitomyces sp. Mi166\
MSKSSSKIADLLKAEGNVFHQAGKYDEAYAKFSEAIKHDPKNAVLWANRAASALGMKKVSPSLLRYLDAVTDAEKVSSSVFFRATLMFSMHRQLNLIQNMRKLGEDKLLGSWEKSIDAFQKALSCLPSTGELSKADKDLKTQFESGLKKAEANKNRVVIFDHVFAPAGSVHQDNLPWKRAMTMEQELIARSAIKSSGFVILFAYKEFKDGLDKMNALKIKTINGQQMVEGLTGGIAALSNAIMRDRRIFHMSDGNFIEKYNKQMTLEARQYKGWTTGGPKLIQDEAPKRLKTLGWGAVRPALAVTVRAWIMRGFLQAAFQTPGATTEFFSDALQVLEWGSRLWKNVPKSDRGAIFEPSFIRGVKRLYCNFLQESWSKSSTTSDLEKIATLAHELLDEEQAPPTGEVDPGFVSSFWIYPQADAHVNLGWYYMKKAQALSDENESTGVYLISASHYLKGASLYPADDEYRLTFLKFGLEALWFAGSPLKITLPIAEQIREGFPVIKKIWEYSGDALILKEQLRIVLEFEEHFMAEIEAGRMTLEDSGGPKGLKVKRGVWIKQDPKNVVLWANRAASALAIKIAGFWDKSIDAFKNALDCLPSTGELLEADEALKAQFKSELEKAEATKNKVATPPEQSPLEEGYGYGARSY